MHEREDYVLSLEYNKTHMPRSCHIAAFDGIRDLISNYATGLLRGQVQNFLKAKRDGVELPPCTKTYKKVMSLPCAHRMQRLARTQKEIKIEDIHWHWRLFKHEDWNARPDDQYSADENKDDTALKDINEEVDTRR